MILTEDFDARLYNALRGPEDAYAIVKENNLFNRFLVSIGELAQTSPLGEQIGAVLLHRHFYAAPGEKLVERPIFLEDGTPALETAPRSSADCGLPTRWKLMDDGRYSPLEYSRDAGAHYVARQLKQDTELLARFSELLRNYRLSEHIGLGIASRKHLPLRDGQVYSEDTTEEGSVVTLKPEDEGENMVPTMWVIEPQARCRVECKANCRPSSPKHIPVHIPRHMY